MFGVSLADRLKAAVNQLEATGSQLQARAIATANSASESVRASSAATPPAGSRPGTPAKGAAGSAAGAAAPAGTTYAPRVKPSAAKETHERSKSPDYATSSQLAESALSGLRRSLNISRSERGSMDLPRSGSPAKEATEEEKGLKVEEANGTAEPKGEALAESTEAAPAPETAAEPPSEVPSEAPSVAPSVAPSEAAEPAAPEEETKSAKKKKKKNKKKGKAAEVVEAEKDKAEEVQEAKEEVKEPPAELTETTAPAAEPTPEPTAEPEAVPEVEAIEEPTEPIKLAPAVEAPAELAAKPDTPPATTTEPEKPTPKSSPAKAKPSEDAKAAMKSAIAGANKGAAASPPPLVSPSKEDDPSKRLADVERRFDDLSTRYTELLTQTHSANKIVRELTPLDGIGDADAFEGWIRMVNGKVEMITTELGRLQNQVKSTESRMEEVRDTYRLESKSQTETIAKLRTQLSTAEGDLSTKAGDIVQLGQLRADLAKAQMTAKEEEEKRSKAISLLKTVRQKLVKVEREKEEIEKDRAEERAQRSRALDDVEKAKAEREREVNKLRKNFDRELASYKERSDKELAARKGSWELEMITTKASHAKELTAKASRITGLEAIVKELHATNAQQFDTIQARQAEAETARSELEGLETRTKDLEFQLREATDRLAMLEDAPRSAAPETPTRETGTPAAEVARLLADAESRAEQRVQDMRARVRTLERERNELEEDWASKLAQRVKELEALRRTIADKEAEATAAAAARRERDARIDSQDSERRELERQMVELRAAVDEAKADVSVAAEAERVAREELAASNGATAAVQTQLDEAKAAHAQLRQNNKTLRDELRKVQSSAQLLERQRNPGVGYWAGGAGATPPSATPTPAAPAASAGSAAGSPPPEDEEEVNLEYLRNVILQFLEHKEMRPNLVRVLSVILRFTPQELRRLNAKLGT